MSSVPQTRSPSNLRSLTKSQRPNEVWLKAFHHAAHAVAGETLGVAYGRIELADTDHHHLDPQLVNRDVISHLGKPGIEAAWPFARLAAIMMLAGHVAESLAFDDFGLQQLNAAFADFMLRAREPEEMLPDYCAVFASATIFVDDVPALIAEIAAASSHLVKTKWRAIEHVAGELLIRGELAEAEVKRLLERKPRRR